MEGDGNNSSHCIQNFIPKLGLWHQQVPGSAPEISVQKNTVIGINKIMCRTLKPLDQKGIRLLTGQVGNFIFTHTHTHTNLGNTVEPHSFNTLLKLKILSIMGIIFECMHHMTLLCFASLNIYPKIILLHFTASNLCLNIVLILTSYCSRVFISYCII